MKTKNSLYLFLLKALLIELMVLLEDKDDLVLVVFDEVT